jgi:hypothetical protein
MPEIKYPYRVRLPKYMGNAIKDMGEMAESVSKAYGPILSTHEKEYGPSTIYQDLSKVIKTNLKNLESLLDSAWAR